MRHWLLKLLLPQRTLRADDVLDERIRLESVSTAIGAIGVMAITFVMYLIFPSDLPQATNIGKWLGVQLCVGFGWLAFIAYHLNRGNTLSRRLWPYLSTIVCSFYGFAWGAGWVYFASSADMLDTAHTQAAVIFTIILGGVFTGGVLATIFHLPSLVSFMLCSLLPPLVSTFVHEGIFHLWFGISLVVYMLACTAFAVNLHTFLMETLEQREEKSWLAKQLNVEKQRAEQASHDKTRFLAAASHDLRQPLQALQFFQQALEEILQPAHVPNAQLILERMKASTLALDSLLNSLLDISKLDAGIQEINREIFPLNAILSRVYQQYAPIAEEEGIVFHYVPTKVYVNTDPLQLERIIQNFIVNAIKHMGGHGRILLGVRRRGEYVRIEVWDNGVGIPETEQENIFHEFYQINNPERNRNKGLGMGLSIVQRLATLLRHEVTVHSWYSRGSVFSVAVPHATPPAASTNIILSSEEHTLNTKGTILVVEDDTNVVDSLCTVLSVWGYRAIISDGTTIAEIINQNLNLRFIISDYQLNEGRTGLDVIQQVREMTGKTIPAVIITGNTSPELHEALVASDIPVSYKPINPILLKKMIG